MPHKTLVAVFASMTLVGVVTGVAEAAPIVSGSVWAEPGTCAASTSLIGGTAPVTGVAVMKDLIAYRQLDKKPVVKGEEFLLHGGQDKNTRIQVYAYVMPAPEAKTEVKFWPLVGFTVDLTKC